MSSHRRIEELAKIEFDGAKSITRYSKVARELLKDLCREFDFAADDFEAVMREAERAGHPLLLGLDVKWRARRVAKRLKRAADATVDAAAEVARFHQQFRKEFAAVLSPPKKRAKFDFEDE